MCHMEYQELLQAKLWGGWTGHESHVSWTKGLENVIVRIVMNVVSIPM